VQDEQPVVRKWGGPLDELTPERKGELARRLWDWNPGMATEERPGPFAGQRLDGLEVFWLACCGLVGRDGDPADGARRLISAREYRRYAGLLPLHLQGTNISGAHLETLYVNSCAGTMSVSPESGLPLRREAIGMSIPRPTSVHTYPATTPRP